MYKIQYIDKIPTTIEEQKNVDDWCLIFNISIPKIELFHDFICGLYMKIDLTYPGHNIDITDEDMKNHYTWCWDEIINNFKQEKIYFKSRGVHYAYFWDFFLTSYYKKPERKDPSIIIKYFDDLFQLRVDVTSETLILFKDIYLLLDKNFKKL